VRVWRTLFTSWLCLAGVAETGAQSVVVDDPLMSSVTVRTVGMRDSGPVVHVFSDPAAAQPLPAVVFVLGYPDDALSIGPLNETEQYRSWARLVAARGMAGVLYSTSSPVEDVAAVMAFLATRGRELGIDGSRLALWVASGNGPVAVGYLRDEGRVDLQAVAALYATLPPGDGFMAAELTTMSTRQGYSLPISRPSDSLPTNVPMLVVRPGNDHPLLLRLMDRFVEWGESEGAQIEVLPYPAGGHSFDTREDTDASRDVIEAVLSFFVTELGVGLRGPRGGSF
jgi:dienelactone hydrolase